MEGHVHGQADGQQRYHIGTDMDDGSVKSAPVSISRHVLCLRSDCPSAGHGTGGGIRVRSLLLKDIGLRDVHESQSLMLGIGLVVDSAVIAGFPGAVRKGQVLSGNLEGDELLQALGVFGYGSGILIDDGELVSLHLRVVGQDVALDVGEFDGQFFELAVIVDNNLLLLDIEMPSNGFQLAQSLIQMEKHPLVVFVTKRHEYAVQGYGIAFRYLVKPLDQTLFAAAMDAVLQELNSKHFTIEYDGVTMSLETSDIYFLESHGHKVLIHCKEQDLTLRMSIPEALEQLPKRCFVSPHKSYLVNMEHIVYATGTAVFLSSGHQLPISRRKRQEFNQIFNAYLGR